MGSSQREIKTYRFGEFAFDPKKMELSKSGRLLEVKMQPARLLKILLENAPDTVSRKTLQEQIWDDGTTVEFEAGLNACVNQLRNALEDSASNPAYIATMPKRGYRFVSPTKNDHKSKFGMAAVIAPVLLFVLVLMAGFLFLVPRNPSLEQPKRLYVGEVRVVGEQLSNIDSVAQYALRLGTINRLKNSDIKVLQTINGVSLWQEILRPESEKNLEYSLKMTLSNREGIFVVDAAVISADSNNVVERQAFPLESIDAPSLDQTAARISNWAGSLFDLSINAEGFEFTQQSPAYFEAMVRARRDFVISKPNSLLQSLNSFNEALQANPASIDAMGGKAMVMALLAGKGNAPSEASYDQALILANEIRQLVGATPQSELTRGFIYLYRDWDLDRSREAFDLALEMAPGDAIVHAWRAGLLAAQGEVAEAAIESEIAVQLDPVSMATVSDRCWYLSAARRFEEAVKACRWAIELDPTRIWSSIGLSVALDKLDRDEEAVDALAPVLTAFEKEPVLFTENQTGEGLSEVDSFSNLQAVHCKIADLLTPRANRGEFPKFELAAFSAQCGEMEMAAGFLREAHKDREIGALFYSIDPRFDEFRTLSDEGLVEFSPTPRT